jgi:ribosomal protein L7Ae-like RNA K-turn-binding protein
VTDTTLERVRGFLGLCGRAGQTVLGQDACVEAVRGETVALVLIDESSSQTTRKRFFDSCTTHCIPLYGVPQGMIAQALGKNGRMTVAIKRGRMARQLLTLLAEEKSLAGMDTDPNDPDPQSRFSSANHAGVQAVQ